MSDPVASSLEALSNALRLAKDGDTSAAFDEVGTALRLQPDSTWLIIRASQLKLVLGDYVGAASLLDYPADRIGELEPQRERWRFRLLAKLWWLGEARSVCLRVLERPKNAAWHAELAEILTARRDYEGALEHVESLLQVADTAAVRLEAAMLAASVGRVEKGLEHVLLGLQREPSPSARLEAARRLVDLGDFEQARAQAEILVGLSEHEGEALALQGSLLLWSGESAAARRIALAGTERPADCAALHRLLAATALVEHDLDTAEKEASHAIELDADDAESHFVLGRTLLERGDARGALTHIDRGLMLEQGFSFGGRLLRLLASIQAGDQPVRLSGYVLGEVAHGLREIDPSAPAPGLGATAAETQTRLHDALSRLGGNLSSTPTFLESGSLRRLSTRTSPRHASRRALELIRVLPPDEVVARFDDVMAQFPESPLPICHRGELHLWLGDYSRAHADFDAALRIDDETRFAWIGLAAVALLEARPQEALEIAARGVRAMHDTEGPALFVYRGAAYRAVGDFDRAELDIERALELNPTRLAAHLERALLHAARNQNELLLDVFERIRVRAPAMVACAAAELGLDTSAGVTPEAARRVVDHCLVMLRGNRSSTCVTFFTAAGQLRAVAPYPSSASRLSEENPHILRDIERQLNDALARVGKSTTRPAD